jgi:DNA polymerase III subunit delta
VALHSGERNKKALEGLKGLDVPGGLVEISCAKVKSGRPTRELLEQEARRAGRRITSDGVDALVMALGADIALLVGALEQLFADSAEDPIDAAEVTATFAGVAEVSGFQLADAVWEGRALLALQRLRWGMVSQTLSGAGAVGSLASGLRAMVKVGGAPRGMSEADVARVAGVPPFKVRILRSAATSWEPGQLAEAVKNLASVDAQTKGGLRVGESLEPAQKVRALEAFVIETVSLQERPKARGRGGSGYS